MLGLKFGDEAVNQELPENQHSDKEARPKNELPQTLLKFDLSRWIFDATIRPSPSLKTAGSPTVCSLLCCSSPPGHSCTTITPLCFIHPAPTFARFLDRERSPTCSALHDDAITYELVYADGEINEEENMAVAFPSPTPGENSPFFTSYYRPFL